MWLSQLGLYQISEDAQERRSLGTPTREKQNDEQNNIIFPNLAGLSESHTLRQKLVRPKDDSQTQTKHQSVCCAMQRGVLRPLHPRNQTTTP